MAREFTSTHVLRLEVVRFLEPDAVPRLHELAVECQRMSNYCWRIWEQWHRDHGTPGRIQSWLDMPKPRPKFDVPPVPKELNLYAECAKAFPMFNVANVASFTKVMSSLLRGKGRIANPRGTKKQTAKGSPLSRWWTILLDLERAPSYTRPLPIPFVSKECRIIPPTAGNKEWLFSTKVERVVKENGKGANREFTAVLRTNTEKSRKYATLLGRIKHGNELCDDEWKLCGSNLVFDHRKRCWVVMLTYRMPVVRATDLDMSRSLHVWAGHDRPWYVSFDDDPERIGHVIGGKGDYLAGLRGRLYMQRKVRQAGYRHCGKSTRGHGRKRATWGWEKLSARWSKTVRTANQRAARAIVDMAKRQKIGRIVYHQPTGKWSEQAFLATAGTWDDKRGKQCAWHGWNWSGLASDLRNACSKAGMEPPAIEEDECVAAEPEVCGAV